MPAINIARTPRQLDIIADTALAVEHTASSSVAPSPRKQFQHTASSSIEGRGSAGRKHTASSSVDPGIVAIERRRITAGMSHSALCLRAGLEKNNWHRLRRGEHAPSSLTLAKLNAAFDAPRQVKPPPVIAAFHRLLMQMVAAQMGFDTAALLATDFSVQRPSNPQWLRAARIRQMAIYITAVELQVGNADLGRAIGDTRANILYARNAIEERREDGNEIDAVLTAVTLQVKAVM